MDPLEEVVSLLLTVALCFRLCSSNSVSIVFGGSVFFIQLPQQSVVMFFHAVCKNALAESSPPSSFFVPVSRVPVFN